MASDGTDAALEELMSFTGLGVDEARILLDAANGQLEHAVALHFDAQDSSAASHAAVAGGDDSYSELDVDEEEAERAEEEDELLGAPAPQDDPRRGLVASLARGLGAVFSYACELPGLRTICWAVARLGGGLMRTGIPGVLGLLLKALVVSPLALLGLMPPPRSARTLREFEVCGI